MKGNLLDYLHLRYKPENVNLKHKKTLDFQDKIAVWSTRLLGTMYAVYFSLFGMGAWILWQVWIDKPFDPYPFAFLLFVTSSIQLPLMSLIMVGQNLSGYQAELRAEEEFKTTESIYTDLEKVLLHLDQQDKKMEKQLELLANLVKKLQSEK